MLVRKIAGNALANPATNGRPDSASHKQPAIAKPAAKPRSDNTSNGTLLAPLGASLTRRLNITAKPISAHNPINPSINSVMTVAVNRRAITNEVKANNAHVSRDTKVVRGSCAASLGM